MDPIKVWGFPLLVISEVNEFIIFIGLKMADGIEGSSQPPKPPQDPPLELLIKLTV